MSDFILSNTEFTTIQVPHKLIIPINDPWFAQENPQDIKFPNKINPNDISEIIIRCQLCGNDAHYLLVTQKEIIKRYCDSCYKKHKPFDTKIKIQMVS